MSYYPKLVQTIINRNLGQFTNILMKERNINGSRIHIPEEKAKPMQDICKCHKNLQNNLQAVDQCMLSSLPLNIPI